MDFIHSSNFTNRVQTLLKKYMVPGLALAVSYRNDTASIGFGHVNVDAPRKPCTPDTLFEIASASKSVTGAALGILIDEGSHGNLSWQSTMSSLLPDDFVMATEELTNMLTIEDIISHRSGFPGHDFSIMGINAEHPDTAKSVTRNLRNLEPSAPIRTKFMYCNMMFTVASYLVEQLSGRAFPDFLEERVFAPLGMASTNLQPERARGKGLGDRMTPGHAWDPEAQRYLEFFSPESPEAQGAGSIITSVDDYIKYVRALMYRQAPMTEEVFLGVTNWRIPVETNAGPLQPDSSPAFYGAGWEVSWYRGYQLVVHGGSVPGYGTYVFFMPQLELGGVIFGNSEGANSVNVILFRELIDEFLGVPEEQRVDWEELEDSRSGDDSDDEEREMRELLCPGLENPEPLTKPLGTYEGVYGNVGYHQLKIEILDGGLFINASDRTLPATITFEHICDGTKFVAHQSSTQAGGDIPMRAGFEVEGEKAARLGLLLEQELEEYIWFDRVV